MARSKVSMACNTCRKMLYGQKGRLGRMTILQVDYRHHQSEKRLRDAAERSGCYICRVVLERIQSHQDSAIRSAKQQKDGPYLTATIKPLRDRRFVFRLDFKLHRSLTVGNSKPVASFVLLGNGKLYPVRCPVVIRNTCLLKLSLEVQVSATSQASSEMNLNEHRRTCEPHKRALCPPVEQGLCTSSSGLILLRIRQFFAEWKSGRETRCSANQLEYVRPKSNSPC